MPDMWEKATLSHDRTWARATTKLLRNAPPGSTVEADDNGKPVLRRCKTIAALRAELEAKRASWPDPDTRRRGVFQPPLIAERGSEEAR